MGTYRPAELASDHPLVPTLGALARQPELERINLGGLTVEEVGRFVARGWAVVPSEELAAALHARTEGNPFFLIELVRLLASEGSLGPGRRRRRGPGARPGCGTCSVAGWTASPRPPTPCCGWRPSSAGRSISAC